MWLQEHLKSCWLLLLLGRDNGCVLAEAQMKQLHSAGDQHRLDDGERLLFLSVNSRSLSEVRGCDTWFARASLRSLSDLLVLPGILSLILDRQPLPPLLLLLLLSLEPPGCHPPFAMLRSPDMMCRTNYYRKSSLIQASSTPSSQSHAPLTSALGLSHMSAPAIIIYLEAQLFNQSCRMQFASGGYL